jgi:hypothetical protein
MVGQLFKCFSFNEIVSIQISGWQGLIAPLAPLLQSQLFPPEIALEPLVAP